MGPLRRAAEDAHAVADRRGLPPEMADKLLLLLEF
jgi:hypothetical protein